MGFGLGDTLPWPAWPVPSAPGPCSRGTGRSGPVGVSRPPAAPRRAWGPGPCPRPRVRVPGGVSGLARSRHFKRCLEHRFVRRASLFVVRVAICALSVPALSSFCFITASPFSSVSVSVLPPSLVNTNSDRFARGEMSAKHQLSQRHCNFA